ncbi:MAG: MMPL family transporter [Deltaproteobacteria bacterium]|nr:MMPL family transporter [Deltaproteobacteria bacterium]
MNSYLKFITKRPVLVLIGLLAITVALSYGMRNLQFNSSVEAFMPKTDADYIKYAKNREVFGDNGRFMIMAVSADNLWSAHTFKKFNYLLTDMEEYKDVDTQKEQTRLSGFNEVATRNSACMKDFYDRFSDDPVFVRFLERKAPTGFKSTDKLSEGAINNLKTLVLEDMKLKRAKMIDTIISPFNAEDITGKNDTLKAYDLVKKDENGNRIIPHTLEGIELFKKRLTSNPAFKKGIYATDPETGRITDFAIIIKFAVCPERAKMVDELNDIVKSYKNLTIIVSGVPFLDKRFGDYIQDDLRRNVPLVILVATIVFFFNFRSIRGVILPLTTLLLSELWTFGLMGHLGYKITTVGGTLPPLLVAVGSSYAIHVLNQYYADFDLITRKGKQKGIPIAMSHITTTIMLAGLTTFAAFMTFLTSKVSAMLEWGVFSAIGVIFAVFISITFIPASLALLPHRYPSLLIGKRNILKTSVVDKALALIAKIAVRHHKKVFVVAGIVFCIAVAGMLRLKVDTDMLHYFKDDDSAKINVLKIGHKFGGEWGFNITIDSKKIDGVKQRDFLKTVERLRRWLVADANKDLRVGRTDAFSDFIKRMHMAMHNDDPNYYKIPENRLDILDYLEIYSGEDSDSDGRVDVFEPFVDPDFQKCNILVRLATKSAGTLGTTETNNIMRKIRQHLAVSLPAPYSFEVTGFPIINSRLAHYIVTGQMQGLFLSLLIVLLVIILLFRRVKAGPLALIDMGMTIIINFGIMGWFSISLDMVTSIIAAITIGIGVDDTIHFLNRYRSVKNENISIPDAVEKTIYLSGKAILFTSLALIFGFLVMVTSHFLPMVLFGILVSLTMVNTTIGSIVLVPAAIRLTEIDLSPPKGAEKRKYINL